MTPEKEKRKWIADMATTIPGKASRTAEFLVNCCAQTDEVFDCFQKLIEGGYQTIQVRGNKSKKVKAAPLSGLHQLLKLLGLRVERMLVCSSWPMYLTRSS